MDADDRVLLLRAVPSDGSPFWFPPGGGVEPGETELDAGRRELVEETGLEAESWRPVISIVPSPGFCTERVHVFLATGLREVARPAAEHEEADMEVVRMPFAEAVDAVLDGRIVNGIAVAGILAAREAIARS